MKDEIYVIDPSVALKWYVPEDYSDLALEILKRLEQPNVYFYAPSYFKIEFSNAIRKYLVRNLIDKELAQEILKEVEELPMNYVEVTWDRIKKAFLFAIKRSLTIYDAVYIILAKELKGKFLTADKKIIKSTPNEPSIMFITEVKKLSQIS